MRAAPIPILAVVMVTAIGGSACRTGSDAGALSAEPASPAPAAESAAPPIVQPGAPGAPSRLISAEEASELTGIGATEADVRFMQGMIHHHAQALDMTALIDDRTAGEAMRLLGLRISLSQEDEIGMMQGWLEAMGEAVPGVHDHHQPGTPLMPGMLTAEEMAQLERARGQDFDRLFLEFMIKHHEGALVMVDELFATPGAGQESNVFAFASEVVADQRAEMDRMGAMLAAMNQERQP